MQRITTFVGGVNSRKQIYDYYFCVCECITCKINTLMPADVAASLSLIHSHFFLPANVL